MLKHPGKLIMGKGTLEIDVALFALNRKRLVERLRAVGVPKGSFVVLQGGKDVPFNDTDIDYIFRQESYFMWTFGVLEPGFYGAISVDTGVSYLFMPRLPSSYSIIMGPIPLPDDVLRKYQVDEVYYIEDMASILNDMEASPLLLLQGVNTDSGYTTGPVNFPGMQDFTLDKELLFNEIADLRVVKTDLELEVMRYVIGISSAAHREVMRMARPGKTEYQCESEFLHYCYSRGGCRNVSYTCIAASGDNSSILHYGHAAAPNNRTIRDGDLCLFDMGANYFGYCADITCTFPANGTFTPDQRAIYEAVLDSNYAVMQGAQPGENWADMHLLANRVLLENLEELGLVQGDIGEMVEAGLGYVFQPHGMGHLLGLDVHDVGGYLPGNPPRRHQPFGLHKLRTSRDLVEGMVLTIEPGCYFIDELLDGALNDPKLGKFLVPSVLDRFRGMGGVRIEDNVVITARGCENLTTVPRTVQDIEDWIAGKDA